MQWVRAAVLVLPVLTVGIPIDARADLLRRTLQRVGDDPGNPATGGGGTSIAAPPPPSELSDWAGPARATSLPELLKQTVQTSPALADARIDVEIAEARIDQTRSRDDWQLRAQLYGSSSSSYFSGFRFDRSTTIGTTFDATRVLPSGGTITLHGGSEYSRSTSPIDGSINTNWSDELSATLVQPLLRGRGARLFEANEHRARHSRDAAVLARRIAAIQTVQTVVAAYWDLVLAERQVAITRASLALANERLRITRIGTDGGKVPRSEIPAVQQVIATREEELLGAELAVLERSIVVRRAVGLPVGAGQLALHVTTDLASSDATWDLGRLTERAFVTSPELAQLTHQDATFAIDLEVNDNGLLPRLDAALTLGPRSQATTFPTAARDLARLDSVAISGSLTFEHSLGQEDVRGRARELRAGRHRLKVNAFDIRAQIAQAMARAVAQLEVARRRMRLSQRAIELARENIAIEASRFDLGKSTNFDVLGRQDELRQAELRRSQAIIDWYKAEATVQALTGDLLAVYGIDVDQSRDAFAAE